MELYIWLAVAAGCGAWMYQDAKKRSLKQPSQWLVIGLLFGVFGLLTYCYWHVWSSKKA